VRLCGDHHFLQGESAKYPRIQRKHDLGSFYTRLARVQTGKDSQSCVRITVASVTGGMMKVVILLVVSIHLCLGYSSSLTIFIFPPFPPHSLLSLLPTLFTLAFHSFIFVILLVDTNTLFRIPLPWDTRVQDLVGRLTIDEKIAQMSHGGANINGISSLTSPSYVPSHKLIMLQDPHLLFQGLV
jgi:hypothetical protein